MIECLFNKENFINYKTCTVEELAKFLSDSPRYRAPQQMAYYAKVGNIAMVEKIKAASNKNKREKLLKQIEGIAE